MKSRFGDLDFGGDENEIQQKAFVLESSLQDAIDQFIFEVDSEELSDETLTAIGLAIDYLNSNHWSNVAEWYGFPDEVGDRIYRNLAMQVYKGSTGVLKKATSEHLRDTN